MFYTFSQKARTKKKKEVPQHCLSETAEQEASAGMEVRAVSGPEVTPSLRG